MGTSCFQFVQAVALRLRVEREIAAGKVRVRLQRVGALGEDPPRHPVRRRGLVRDLAERLVL
jgi:hypothetical protein